MREALLAAVTQLVGFGFAVAAAAVAADQDGPRVLQHMEVCSQPGRFAGWPANNGIWSWGDEIVIVFTLGYHTQKSGHTIDPDLSRGALHRRCYLEPRRSQVTARPATNRTLVH